MKKTWKDTAKDYRKLLERRYRLLEDKTRFINNLNLTDDQKTKLKTFFKNHPNYENKIDWNNKNLTFDDFSELLSLEGNTKSSKKKYGLSGKAQIEDLVIDKDYKIIDQGEHYTIYYPLTFKASEVLAKPSTPPLNVTGRWCISGRNYSPGTRDQHWIDYTNEGVDFFFVFLQRTKWAIARYPDNTYEVFNEEDEDITNSYDICETDLNGQYYQFGWDIEDLCERIPHYLEELRWVTGEDGNVYSKDWTILHTVSKDVKELVVPEGVVKVQASAGFNCSNLRKITISDSVQNIGDGAFGKCWYVENIHIGNGLKQSEVVNAEPFVHTTGKVTFSEGLKYIGNWLFNKSLISEVTFPKSLEIIGFRAFSECENLKHIELPEGLTQLYSSVFYDSGLESVSLPSTLKQIGKCVFTQCYNLKEIEVPGSIRDVMEGTFWDCENLEKVVLGEGIRSIHPKVFMGCKNLKEIYLPSTLQSIAPDTFQETSEVPSYLKDVKINFAGTKELFEKITVFNSLKWMRDNVNFVFFY